MTTPAPTKTDKQVFRDGWIADLRRARKYHLCSQCQETIQKGNQYYSIVIGGGGLGSLKFPDRAHPECLEGFFQRHKRLRGSK